MEQESRKVPGTPDRIRNGTPVCLRKRVGRLRPRRLKLVLTGAIETIFAVLTDFLQNS